MDKLFVSGDLSTWVKSFYINKNNTLAYIYLNKINIYLFKIMLYYMKIAVNNYIFKLE